MSFTVMGTYAGDANHCGSSGTGTIFIIAKSLSVDATTRERSTSPRRARSPSPLQITDGLLAANNDIAALFNGATFTITVSGTSYSLTSTATVNADGSLTVQMKMNQDLQNALLTALDAGSTVDFRLSAYSSDLDYSIDADAISRLISQGKLKYAVT